MGRMVLAVKFLILAFAVAMIIPAGNEAMASPFVQDETIKVYNVQNAVYGAKGNGTTDDTAAI